jgi:hypothetical protein
LISGFWLWVWEISACEGGSIPAIIAKAKGAGVSGLIVKCGEDGPGVEQVTPALVRDCAAAGMRLAVWWYCRPRATQDQIAMLNAVAALGVTIFVMDAEKEWDTPDQRPLARAFAVSIRAALGSDAILIDAPWSRPKKHGGSFPYDEFGLVMGARSPQFYWELAEVAGESEGYFLDDCDAEWAETDTIRPICPALCAVNQDGTVHAPVSELAAALDRYAGRPFVTLWSFQHLNSAEWALLEQRARAAAPIPDPLAGVPVPGLVIPGEDTDVT